MLKAMTVEEKSVIDADRVIADMPAPALTVITTPAALRELEVKWRVLEAHTQNHTSVFQTFDWVMAWSETYIDQKSGNSLHVLAGYENDELVFVWPLMRNRKLGISILTWLTEPFGQYGDVLCRTGHSSKKWVESSIAFLKRLKDVDILRLRHVRADSHLASHAASLLIDARLPEGAPFLDLTQYADDDAYDARYTSAQRKRRRKIRKGIEELGAITFERLPTGILADAAMQNAIAEKNAWLAERGRINRVLGCPDHISFLKNLSRRAGSSVDVVVTEMKAGSKPISWELGFRYKNTHFGYITSHVNKLTDISPGRLHMDYSQRSCLKDGMGVYDLMIPNDAHKESWSSGIVATNDYFLPLSFTGSIIGHTYIRLLRPMLRNIYYRLDAATLRKMNLKKIFKPST